MNTQTHEAVGTSPYELVFGQKPRSVLFPTGKSPGIILEKSLADDGICTSTSDPVNETLQQGLGEMRKHCSRSQLWKEMTELMLQ